MYLHICIDFPDTLNLNFEQSTQTVLGIRKKYSLHSKTDK